MTIAYLNGDYAPLADVRISPMDRGFLFGDGVYEVIPCYDGKMVALQYHLERLHQSLDGIALSQPYSDAQLINILNEIVARNGAGNLGIYLQMTRGVVEKRQHAFPENPLPTVFAYAFDINPPSDGSPETAACFRAVTRRDQRWGRCHIKSTALLGNVLHMMEAVEEAVARARKGDGPTFLEAKTYRYKGHSMSDAQHYRTKDEVSEYQKIDPINTTLEHIKKNKFASEKEIEAINLEVKETIAEAIKFADESPFPTKQDLYDSVYEQVDYPFIKD